jgi:sarcosine oxidase subunit beta
MPGQDAWDYVVVGGGVYGAGVAWELARQGADVLLLEAETVASGASGGLGKRGVRACGRDVRELPLMRIAYELWPKLANEIGAPTGYERTEHLVLIESLDDEALARAQAEAWMQREQGIPTDVLDAAEVHRLEPSLSDAVQAALSCPLDGDADHTQTTCGLARAAERLGATIREQTRVVGIEREGERVSAVMTAQGERIGVRRELLLLANMSVAELARTQLGVALPVWRMLPLVLTLEPVNPMPLHHLIAHTTRTLSMKAVPGNHVMISGGWHGRWNPQTKRGELILEQVAGNVAEAVAVYPSLSGVAVHEADSSRSESVCIDGIPIIGRLPGASNLLIGTGWSGHGFAISLAVNQLLAGWALTGTQPDLLRPFAYERFLAPDVA